MFVCILDELYLEVYLVDLYILIKNNELKSGDDNELCRRNSLANNTVVMRTNT